MRHTLLFQHNAQLFGLGNGSSADQDRPPRFMQLHDFLYNGPIFSRPGFINHIWEIGTDHGLIRGDHDNIQTVDFLELLFLRFRRTRHARQLFIHTEIILEGDRGQGLAFTLYLYAFFRFDSLMQAFRETAPVH